MTLLRLCACSSLIVFKPRGSFLQEKQERRLLPPSQVVRLKMSLGEELPGQHPVTVGQIVELGPGTPEAFAAQTSKQSGFPNLPAHPCRSGQAPASMWVLLVPPGDAI